MGRSGDMWKAVACLTLSVHEQWVKWYQRLMVTRHYVSHDSSRKFRFKSSLLHFLARSHRVDQVFVGRDKKGDRKNERRERNKKKSKIC